MTDLAVEVGAIRRSVAVSDISHLARLRVDGQHAFELLDRRLPCDLYLRNGEIRHTVLLKQDGTVCADLYLGRDGEGYFLLADGINAPDLEGALREGMEPGEEVQLEDLGDKTRVLSLNGPFAWELMSAYDSPGVIGLPYRTFYRPEEGVLCLRAGKTGEFGYDLLVARERADGLWQQLVELAAKFEGRPASLEALDFCGLENWFFNARHEGRRGLDPVELQLQWRLASGKVFWGHEALAERRARPDRRRLTAFRSEACLHDRAAVTAGDETVGEIVRACPTLAGEGSFGLALIDVAMAHSGVEHFRATHGEGSAAMRTLSPPFVVNHSLFVKPMEHSWEARDEIPFPPVCQPPECQPPGLDDG